MLFKVCAPHPCSLKTSKTDKSTACNLCAPGPCVMMTRARSKSTNGIKDNAECKVCAPKPCIMKRSQSQSSDCKVCAPKPCVLKTKDKEKEEKCRYRVYTTDYSSLYNHACCLSALICRFCPPGKCIKKKSPGEPSACKVCAPKPCILKKTVDPQENLKKSTSECKVCAPHPCVLVSEGKPLKSPKLVVRSKSAASSGDCRLCAPDPWVLKKKKKEETCPHCQHLQPCAFN